jgi:acetyltransferase-like isoleucine patch superfamily enzyme
VPTPTANAITRLLASYLPESLKVPLRALRSLFREAGSGQKPDSSAPPPTVIAPPEQITAADHGPPVSHSERVIGMSGVRSIHPTARLVVRERPGGSLGKITFGPDVYVGKEVELAALGEISIGRDTSIQNYGIIHGDVEIGAFCMFGPYVMISSTIHRFRDVPYWHIRDQDELILEKPDLAVQPISDKIVIEDDCWIGSTVAMMPGVYIGRGAVVGANSVVTSDVGPFEVHGGVPNRKIGTRLDFAPPKRISAMEDTHLPYFYRGLRTSQSELRKSRTSGMVASERCACVVLAHRNSPSVTASFVGSARDNRVRIRVRINGVDAGTYEIADGESEILVNAAAGLASSVVPKSLARWTYLEFEDVSSEGERIGRRENGFGIRYVALNDGPSA